MLGGMAPTAVELSATGVQQFYAEEGQREAACRAGEFAAGRRHLPIFSAVTLLLCTAAMVWELYENGRLHGSDDGSASAACHFRLKVSEALFCAASFSINPLFGPMTDVLVKLGGAEGRLIVEGGEVWRLIAPMYLHGGVVHFAMNMLVFCRFGFEMERTYGFARVAVIYLLSGFFGLLMGVALSPHSVSVGASGAIFGLFGAMVGEVLQNWGLYRRPCCALVQLLMCVIVQLLLGTMPMVDNFSHFFGFVMGFLCSMVLLVMKRQTHDGRQLTTRCHQRFFQVAASACVVTCLLLAVLLTFGRMDAKELCPRCDMISCIPFPWGCDQEEQGSCWGWDCLAAELAGCSGSASWRGTLQNGTVVLGCPRGLGQTEDVQVWPVDVSHWDNSALMHLCKEHCL